MVVLFKPMSTSKSSQKILMKSLKEVKENTIQFAISILKPQFLHKLIAQSITFRVYRRVIAHQ